MRRIAEVLSWLWIGTLLAPGAAFGMDRFGDWRAGDLVFQESSSAQATAIRVATASRYTHMGIVVDTDEGLRVLEAERTVSETPLAEFIARGTGQDYSVYRVSGLTAEAAEAAIEAARAYHGRPYDVFFRLDPDAIYCSELPFHAFRTIGVELGRIQRLGELDIDTPEGRAIFLARWQDHPDCKAQGLDRGGCWDLIQRQEIVTPVSIAVDPGVEQVFSTFGGAP